MACPTCGCVIHTKPTPWHVTCSVCKNDKYPSAVERPAEPYVCTLCRGTRPGRREAARRAGAAAQAKKRLQGTPPSAGDAA